jgi:hypothetical protein
LRDVSKLVPDVANYNFRSSFTTQTLHLEGEAMFGSTRRGANFLPSADDGLHKLDRVNFSCPCVVVLTCQPKSVDNLSILGLTCVTQNMFLIRFQGDIMVSEIMCGNGIWHIDKCFPSSTMQCFALQNNIGVKCIGKINTHKTTSGTPIPCYFGFWA